MKAQLKNQLYSLEATIETPDIVIEQTQVLIASLDKQISLFRNSALEIINKHEDLKTKHALITSVKGIADASAIQLLGELLALPPELSVKEWVAYAGLDPKHIESGTSVSKRTRISKAGNRYLRQALYMPALVASHSEPNVTAYYEHLQQTRGLRKMQAICAVMRKLLHAIYGMFHSNKPFEGEKFYKMNVA